MQVVTLKVPRIHCGGCVKTVTQALGKVPGVLAVEASETTKEVRLQFDPAQVSEEKIRTTLALIGYPAA
ncbi:MAG: heavy-metal-associated domain-containing protein [Armatimonadota bacterium]|nr:heavy-metal-associated domain-containing protein [Armatimonadota bacterium]MDR7400827.1 heavy-metal-associated domain-containing protein [Armatimonadota bacterium]MDR7404267.1 heavy-metal-associated domain-containing protein [Armatimonadota bacterium]MDR7436580.1 heavy-metal-associated domain-containing protein [Armatimonadota bacterium]MDR7473108.1 heavy-metal-associated domain-containing protein [Armatimonadota bacterium]